MYCLNNCRVCKICSGSTTAYSHSLQPQLAINTFWSEWLLWLLWLLLWLLWLLLLLWLLWLLCTAVDVLFEQL